MSPKYDIHLVDKYGQLAVIDIAAEAAEHEPWFNQTLTSVDGANSDRHGRAGSCGADG
jgi:hypothetical protein